MTKKSLFFILAIAVCIVAFVSCENTNVPATSHTHTFGEWTTIKDATCAAKGSQERSCTCGEKEMREIDETKHTEISDPAVPPTCTTEGKTEGKHCSICNSILVSQQTVSVLPHTYDDDYDSSCNICSTIRQINCKHDVPSKIEILPAVNATCTTTGLTQGMKCTLCGTMVVPQAILAIIDCTPSNWIIDQAVTKNENGFKHIECTMCGTHLDEEIILATGSLGLLYETNLNNNTCVISGLGQCTDTEIIIPQTIDSFNVIGIKGSAFYGCSNITSISIPQCVVSIGEFAFYGCTNLASINIPENVSTIVSPP